MGIHSVIGMHPNKSTPLLSKANGEFTAQHMVYAQYLNFAEMVFT